MDSLKHLNSVIENSFVQRARAEGQPVIGYACLSTPREVLDAAGFFPYRLKALGRGNTDMADAYLSRFNCGFCRACLQLGLDGTYDFLDGIIETNGCDHLRGMFENWQYVSPRPFFHYLRVPHLNDCDSLKWFREEIELFRGALQKHFAVTIDDSALDEAIKIQDQTAALMQEVYKFRLEQDTRVKGSEIIALMVAEGSVPAKDYQQLLSNYIVEVQNRKPLNFRARLFMGGAATDETELLAELEELGGLIVGDSFCFSGRLLQRKAPAADPLTRLAEIYLGNLLCPRMYLNYRQRKSFISEMIRQCSADGIVLFHNKFCDLHGIENVKLKMDFEKEGLPVLLLEKEYGSAADSGRLKTRLQAFLEQLGR